VPPRHPPRRTACPIWLLRAHDAIWPSFSASRPLHGTALGGREAPTAIDAAPPGGPPPPRAAMSWAIERRRYPWIKTRQHQVRGSSHYLPASGSQPAAPPRTTSSPSLASRYNVCPSRLSASTWEAPATRCAQRSQQKFHSSRRRWRQSARLILALASQVSVPRQSAPWRGTAWAHRQWFSTRRVALPRQNTRTTRLQGVQRPARPTRPLPGEPTLTRSTTS
jgi:hypothetical protein